MPGTFPMIIRGFLPGCLNVSLCYLSLHAAYFRTGNFPCVTTCRQSLVNLYFLPIRQSRKFSGPQQRKPRNSEVWKNILYNSSKNQKLVYAQSFSGWQAEVGHPITGQQQLDLESESWLRTIGKGHNSMMKIRRSEVQFLKSPCMAVPCLKPWDAAAKQYKNLHCTRQINSLTWCNTGSYVLKLWVGARGLPVEVHSQCGIPTLSSPLQPPGNTEKLI